MLFKIANLKELKHQPKEINCICITECYLAVLKNALDLCLYKDHKYGMLNAKKK